jgi:hypothetical protein
MGGWYTSRAAQSEADVPDLQPFWSLVWAIDAPRSVANAFGRI